jgi:hypothetical protein
MGLLKGAENILETKLETRCPGKLKTIDWYSIYQQAEECPK